jgi:hypothetical protein
VEAEDEPAAAARTCSDACLAGVEAGAGEVGRLLWLLGRHPRADVVKLRQSPAILVPDCSAAAAAAAPAAWVAAAPVVHVTSTEELRRLRPLRWPGVRRDLRTKCFLRMPAAAASGSSTARVPVSKGAGSAGSQHVPALAPPAPLLLPTVHGPASLLQSSEWSAQWAGDSEPAGVELVPAGEGYFLHFMSSGQHESLEAARQRAWSAAANVCDAAFAAHLESIATGAFSSSEWRGGGGGAAPLRS